MTTPVTFAFSLILVRSSADSSNNSGFLRGGPAVKSRGLLDTPQPIPLHNPPQFITCNLACPIGQSCAIDTANNQELCVCNDDTHVLIDGQCVENHCLDTSNASPCTSNQICLSEKGGFACETCESGYAPDQAFSQCVLVDYCLSDQNTCQADELCINDTNDSSTGTCQHCPSGYEPDQGKNVCVDQNECLEGLHDCADNQLCRNTNGGFICAEYCDEGHVPNMELEVCIDENECLDSSKNTCDENNQVCFNNDGGYDCGETCPPGTVPDNTIRQCVASALP